MALLLRASVNLLSLLLGTPKGLARRDQYIASLADCFPNSQHVKELSISKCAHPSTACAANTLGTQSLARPDRIDSTPVLKTRFCLRPRTSVLARAACMDP
ncbi:hypothetical protein JCGZ_05246 [Jatropha curcas]|uniref:Secreted protein n=1 Tax=Jatropha curcas TaxID=180498 RepID=A0A067JKF8_JATCU|nr:hypothetical protein JCGZ_05246 [Jatropha curcas]